MNKIICLCLGLGLAVNGLATVNHDISTGPLTISDSEEYVVTGSSSNNCVTVTAGNPVITLSNVDMQMAAGGAFIFEAGNATVLTTGSNTVYGGETDGLPAFYVKSGASVAFNGEGILVARARNGQSAAIGGTHSAQQGDIAINGGTITAQGALFAAAIGGGSHCNGGTITISGGFVTASAGGYAAGIGGGTGWEGHAGNILISGGYVKATASQGAGIGVGDCGGHNIYPAGQITITGGTVEGYSEGGAGIGAGCASGDDGCGPAIFISGGSVYGSSQNGSPVGQGQGKGQCPDLKNAGDGEKVYRVTLEGAISQAGEYVFTVEKDGQGYSYSYSGPGYESLSDLYFYLPNGAYEITGAGKTYKGMVKDADISLQQAASGSLTLDLSCGNAFFTSLGARGYSRSGQEVEGFYSEYVLTGQTTNSCVLVSSGTHKIILDGLDIAFSNVAFAITGGAVNLIVTNENCLASQGGAGLRVAKGASLTIDGTGSLVAKGAGEGSGIGGNGHESSGHIEILGGDITAEAALYGAGLGGGSHGVADVAIKGGVVRASSLVCGAGIGGGTGWEGNAGKILIEGGLVYANGNNGAGIGVSDCGGHNVYPAGQITITGGAVKAFSVNGAGIGAGSDSGDSGRGPQVYISGGSVWAASNNGSPIGQGKGLGECPELLNAPKGEKIYRALLEGAIADREKDWTFAMTRDGQEYGYSYTGRGYEETADLYFYLPDGLYKVSGGEEEYNGAVAGADTTFYRQLEGSMTLDISYGPAIITSLGAQGFDERGWAVSGLCKEYIIQGSTTSNGVTVTSGTHEIVLDAVEICNSNMAFDVQGGTVSLTITNECVISTQSGAGIHVSSESTLNLKGSGVLNVSSTGGEGAGIGGGARESSGKITIESGEINVTGAPYGAGIGGGSHGASYVTINGGSITAVGGAGSAGIGGGTGYEGHAGEILITGGKIIAEAASGAGIGCSDQGGHDRYPAGQVTITGGTIDATSDTGAGIGAGGGMDELGGRGPNIYISGGSVFAMSTMGDPVGQGAGFCECPTPLTAPEGEPIYEATLPEAMPFIPEEVTYSVIRDNQPYGYSYTGMGHDYSMDLYFYLPNGHYVTGNGSECFEGDIKDASAVFEAVPEPCFGLLALLALALLRRK